MSLLFVDSIAAGVKLAASRTLSQQPRTNIPSAEVLSYTVKGRLLMVETNTNETEQNAGRVNLDKLELNKETITDLTPDEAKHVKGGVGAVGEVGGAIKPRPPVGFMADPTHSAKC